MVQLSALGDQVDRVCEIGPESCHYAQQVIVAVRPTAYEIYDAAPDWLPYLRRLPGVVARHGAGNTLSATPSASVDLVHAHRFFTHTPFCTTLGYLTEMARVTRPGGVAAFDVITELCVDGCMTNRAENSLLRSVTPRSWAIELLERRGLALVGNHFEPFGGALTELLVFRKE